MTDYSALDAAVTAIRPKNPAIARAFDQVEAILKTVAPPGGTPPPPPPGGPSFPTFAQPAFTPTRTLVATSRAQFDSLVAARRAGDRINVQGVTLAGEVTLSGALAGWSEIIFDSACRFTGAPAGSRLPALWLNGCANLGVYGIDATGAGNQGVLVYDSTNCVLQGKAHDTAGTGVSIFGITKPCDRIQAWFEVWNCGRDLSLDPHAQKGTGNHGVNVGGGTGQPVTNSKLVLDVHDQPFGAALEFENFRNSEAWIRAKRITCDVNVLPPGPNGERQVAGNAVQGWGSGSSGVHFPYIKADQVARVVELTAGYAGQTTTVDYARGTNVRLSPAYVRLAGVSYADVQP